MMKLRHIKILAFILFLLVFASCSKFQKLLKSSDFNLKYEKAVEYYEKEDYYRALSLFEDIENIFKVSEKGQRIQYYMAYCYYNQGQHLMAGYYFRNFARRFPTNIHAEECEYMTAYCLYLNSPEPSLDQEYTVKAINELQAFMNKYPNSERIEEANKLMSKLRHKLEVKSFKSAKLYYDLGDYKAAGIALQNNLKDYPDSPFREEVRFLLLKSQFLFAEKSIASKKTARYQTAINEYYALIADFPETKYLREAKRMFNDASEKIKNK